MSYLLRNFLIFATILSTTAGTSGLAGGAGTELAITGPKPLAVASRGRGPCIWIRTAAELDNIRYARDGHYCLANDIDLARIGNFPPIPTFSGVFDGRGHRILNLTINRPSGQFLGLFGTLTGTVTNVGLVNASVLGGREVGALAGRLLGDDSLVSQSYSTGFVSGYTTVGGLVGWMASTGTVVHDKAGEITDSYSAATVEGDYGGGLVGDARPGSVVSRSFATGRVKGGRKVGGLIGSAKGAVSRSYALSPTAHYYPEETFGGLIGGLYNPGSVTQSYAAGRVEIGGGLVGYENGSPRVTASYWDVNTTGQATSAGGLGLSTDLLQRRLRVGFSPADWAITPDVSYPYLKSATGFQGALAAVTVDAKVYVFLPIRSRDRGEYEAAAPHRSEASKAAVYTMIARAFGVTDEAVELIDVPVDRYFWNDVSRTATWAGPVTALATLGPLTPIPQGQPIIHANVLGPIKARKAVIVSGPYQKPGGGVGTHWMLATSFTTGDDGAVTALIANDPWTGKQVRIDPLTKMIIAPPNLSNFKPLQNFKLTGYQVVTLTPPPPARAVVGARRRDRLPRLGSK